MNEAQRKELQRLLDEAPGRVLLPAAVVAYAADPNTALHAAFDWDDASAAQQHRLRQAREILRVAVIVDEASGNNVRAFVSLTTDRERGGGYRAAVDVYSSADLLQQHLQDALQELRAFQRKYRRLEQAAELHGVFEAIKLADRQQPRPPAGEQVQA